MKQDERDTTTYPLGNPATEAAPFHNPLNYPPIGPEQQPPQRMPKSVYDKSEEDGRAICDDWVPAVEKQAEESKKCP